MPKFTECRKCMCWMDTGNPIPNQAEFSRDSQVNECYRHAPVPRLRPLDSSSENGGDDDWLAEITQPQTHGRHGCFEGIPRDGEPKDAPHPQDIRIEESTLAELHEREAYEALARACAEKHELADETDTAGFAKLLVAEEDAYDALDALKPRKAKRT